MSGIPDDPMDVPEPVNASREPAPGRTETPAPTPAIEAAPDKPGPSPMDALPPVLQPQRWLTVVAGFYLCVWVFPALLLAYEARNPLDVLGPTFVMWTVLWGVVALPSGLIAGMLATRMDRAALPGGKVGRSSWYAHALAKFTMAHWATLLLLTPAFVFRAMVWSHRNEDFFFAAVFSLVFWVPVVVAGIGARVTTGWLRQRSFDAEEVADAPGNRVPSRVMLAGMVGWFAALPLPFVMFATLKTTGSMFAMLFVGLCATAGLSVFLAKMAGAARQEMTKRAEGFSALAPGREDQLSRNEVLGTVWVALWMPVFAMAVFDGFWSHSDRLEQVALYCACTVFVVVGVWIGASSWKERVLEEGEAILGSS